MAGSASLCLLAPLPGPGFPDLLPTRHGPHWSSHADSLRRSLAALSGTAPSHTNPSFPVPLPASLTPSPYFYLESHHLLTLLLPPLPGRRHLRAGTLPPVFTSGTSAVDRGRYRKSMNTAEQDTKMADWKGRSGGLNSVNTHSQSMLQTPGIPKLLKTCLTETPLTVHRGHSSFCAKPLIWPYFPLAPELISPVPPNCFPPLL